MTEDEPTKDLTEQLTDRQLLLELRQAIGALHERMTELERRTNPLPPNYDARFAGLEGNIKEMRADLKLLREDIRNERRERVYLEERVMTLEGRPS
jgi:hypothetical protein